MSSSRTYPITYELTQQDPPLTKEEVRELGRNVGAADALIVLSIIFPEDGSYSMQPASIDGRTGSGLSAKEIFKAWLMLTAWIGQLPDLDDLRREMAKHTFETISEVIMRRKVVAP